MLEFLLKQNPLKNPRGEKPDSGREIERDTFTHGQIHTLSLDPLPLSEFPKEKVFLSKNVTVIILLAAVLSCGLTVPRPHTAGLHYRSVHVNLAHMFCPMRVVPAQDSLHQHNYCDQTQTHTNITTLSLSGRSKNHNPATVYTLETVVIYCKITLFFQWSHLSSFLQADQPGCLVPPCFLRENHRRSLINTNLLKIQSLRSQSSIFVLKYCIRNLCSK